LPRAVVEIWMMAESSSAKEEDGKVWTQESRMRERESAYKIPSPLPTHAMLGKALCALLGAITPCATLIANDM
jgi:hypothetical protein